MSKTRHQQIRSLSVRYSPGHVIDWHSHIWSQLVYSSEGVITVEVKDACWVVPTNRALWVPGGTEHSVRLHGRTFLQTLYFPPENDASKDLKCGAYEVSRLLHELIVSVCEQGIVNGDTDEKRIWISFLTYQILKLRPFPLAISMPNDDRARRFACHVLNAPGAEKSLQELSEECGISLRTMQRIFSRELGIPLARWRHQVKLVHSVELLGTGKSVTEVSFELGFESVSSFIYAFRRTFGASPGQYRAIRHRGEQT